MVDVRAMGPSVRYVFDSTLKLGSQVSYVSTVTGSDLLYYESWGRSFIVINSLDGAIDLLERRSALYADRCVAALSCLVRQW